MKRRNAQKASRLFSDADRKCLGTAIKVRSDDQLYPGLSNKCLANRLTNKDDGASFSIDANKEAPSRWLRGAIEQHVQEHSTTPTYLST